MKRSLLFSAALIFGSAYAVPALAQDGAATPAPQPAAPASPADPASSASQAPAPTSPAAPASFTDAELVGFANAAIEADKIQKDAAIAPADKQTQMLAAVEAQGLDPARYNEIAQATRSDPALVQKIQELAAANMANQQGTQNTATP